MADVNHDTYDHTGIPGVPASGSFPAGSSFPGSPSTNDLFFHTTYGMIFKWDGTRWVTVTLYTQPLDTQRALNNLSATNTFDSPLYQDGSVWLEKFMASMYVITTNDGTRYWTAACEGVTLSTQSLAADTTHILQGNINAVKAGSAGPTGMSLTNDHGNTDPRHGR